MIIGVGVILRRPDGRVLIGRRIAAGMPDCWCLPGGKVDTGERFEDAARRETLEECGIDSGPTSPPFAILLMTLDGGPCVTAAFTIAIGAAAEARVTEPLKLAEWRWCRPDALPTPLFAPTVAILDAAAGRPTAGAAVYRTLDPSQP